jgi:hypothetical protein
LLKKAEIEESKFNGTLKDRVEASDEEFASLIKEAVYDDEKKNFTLSSSEKHSITILKGKNKNG